MFVRACLCLFVIVSVCLLVFVFVGLGLCVSLLRSFVRVCVSL